MFGWTDAMESWVNQYNEVIRSNDTETGECSEEISIGIALHDVDSHKTHRTKGETKKKKITWHRRSAGSTTDATERNKKKTNIEIENTWLWYGCRLTHLVCFVPRTFCWTNIYKSREAATMEKARYRCLWCLHRTRIVLVARYSHLNVNVECVKYIAHNKCAHDKIGFSSSSSSSSSTEHFAVYFKTWKCFFIIIYCRRDLVSFK